MTSLLTLSIIVEPDLQRLARFTVEAVEALGGNVFAATAAAPALIDGVRRDCRQAEGSIDVHLRLEGEQVLLAWEGELRVLATLPKTPPPEQVASLVEQLRMASESADPELLRRRNQRISDELESFMQVAAEQMREMEAVLEKKKQELQESIRVAETDSLTGLLNRGAYDNRLLEAYRRTRRQREPLSLLLLDLDFFKQVNDTHGHQYGDEYLKRMADVMRQAIREHVDLPCRTGGDEFAIISFCEADVAERQAASVLQGMAGRVSIGIARCLDGDSMHSLVARADAALYEAKRQGRGRYAVAGDLPLPDEVEASM